MDLRNLGKVTKSDNIKASDDVQPAAHNESMSEIALLNAIGITDMKLLLHILREIDSEDSQQ